MVANLVIVLIILSIYYVYTNHNREFTATASAIQEIWSGSCRLSCRQSGYSGYSGYSGLSGLVSGQNTESSYLSAVRSGSTAVCVCDSCPCELVENVLRTCSPATNVYTRTIEFISDYYYDLVKTLCDFFNYINQVMRCGVNCQRQPQMLPVSRLNSIGHISFGSTKEEDEKEKPAKNILKPTKFTFPKRPESDDFEHKPTSSRTSEGTAISVEISDTTIFAKSPAESEQLSNSCSKCIEKGKTCMVSKCPIFCILKAVFVALLAIFVLFFPIGDPAELCNTTNKSRNQNVPLTCLCNFYIETIRLFNKTKEVTELVVCRALDLLYEAKLKLYAALNKMDGADLYQSVCCKDSEVSAEDAEQRLACKCTRKCCSCRKKTAEN